jgi:hypothetical protein
VRDRREIDERLREAHPRARIDRIELLDAPLARRHLPPHAQARRRALLLVEHGELLVECARTVHRVVRNPYLDAPAGQHRAAREFGHRASARRHHIEDDQRTVRDVRSAENMRHGPCGLVDGAEIPLRRLESEALLRAQVQNIKNQ